MKLILTVGFLVVSSMFSSEVKAADEKIFEDANSLSRAE